MKQRKRIQPSLRERATFATSGAVKWFGGFRSLKVFPSNWDLIPDIQPGSPGWRLGGRERCYLGAGASAVAKEGVEQTGGGCVNNSAAIKYSGTSCGWTRINSLGRLFPSSSFLNLLFIHTNKALSPTRETRKRVTLKANR